MLKLLMLEHDIGTRTAVGRQYQALAVYAFNTVSLSLRSIATHGGLPSRLAFSSSTGNSSTERAASRFGTRVSRGTWVSAGDGEYGSSPASRRSGESARWASEPAGFVGVAAAPRLGVAVDMISSVAFIVFHRDESTISRIATQPFRSGAPSELVPKSCSFRCGWWRCLSC